MKFFKNLFSVRAQVNQDTIRIDFNTRRVEFPDDLKRDKKSIERYLKDNGYTELTSYNLKRDLIEALLSKNEYPSSVEAGIVIEGDKFHSLYGHDRRSYKYLLEQLNVYNPELKIYVRFKSEELEG